MFNHYAFTSQHLLNTLAKFNCVIAPENIQLATSQLGNLQNNSQLVATNDIFCAVIGSVADGRKYIEAAANQGAAVILSECIHSQQHGKITYLPIKTAGSEKRVPIIHFYQLNAHLFDFACDYYGHPENEMDIIGVTGTNGKTSTTSLIPQLLSILMQKSAVIGTVGAGVISSENTQSSLIPLENTTPGATQLVQLLASFHQAKVMNVAMEVSSHALAQKRLLPKLVNIAVFTNLTRDHLDFHQSMQAYADAKKMIFTQNAEQIAVLNADDEQAQKWLAQWPETQPLIVFAIKQNVSHFSAFVKANNIQLHTGGVRFTLSTHLGEVEVKSPLLGEFNLENLLAAIAVLIAKKISLTEIAHAVTQVLPIIGRMEVFSAENKPTAIVDYAHTPDALANAIKACREHCLGDLWLVFGCGGDRDQGKRKEMGRIAEQGADHIVITNDNPRNEAPELIAQAILSGCKHTERVAVILDRAQAVKSTLAKAKANDIVLLTGKGHEDYIMMGDKKINYNEREIVAQYYKNEVSV
jgi:UDP-N-acetylmuramoyl-L-alanyl-D-glutamate--2,6-diaminopimelate ligase